MKKVKIKKALIFAIILSSFSIYVTPNQARSSEQAALSGFVEFGLNIILQSLVSGLRSILDLRYEEFQIESNNNSVSILELQIKPYPSDPLFNSGQLKNCSASVGTITLLGNDYMNFNTSELGVEIVDFKLSNLCLNLQQRGILASLGVSSLSIPYATLNIKYKFPTSSAKMLANLEIEGVGNVMSTIDVPYLAIGSNYNPVQVWVSNAMITLTNDGIWENASQTLPEEFFDPKFSGHLISEMFLEVVLSEIISNEKIKEDILSQFNIAWSDFINEPNSFSINLQSQNKFGTYINENIEDVDAFLQAFEIKIFAGQTMMRKKVGNKDLLSIKNLDFQNWSAKKKLNVGLQLLSGVGIPKNSKNGLLLIQDAAKNGNSEAANIFISEMEKEDLETAYYFAQDVIAKFDLGAGKTLNRLERKMTLQKILHFQSSVPEDRLNSQMVLEQLSSEKKSLSYYHAQGTPRSYSNAYYWSAISKATGSTIASRIMSEIENKSRSRTQTEKTVWTDMLGEIQNKALLDWSAHVLADNILKD
jgi:hypothetical protein